MRSIALVLGESLVDVVDGTPHPGGSPANVAVALARLGRPVRFGTAYADDADGALVRAHLERAGVRPAGDGAVAERTSRAVARLREDGSADYAFDLDWRLGEIEVPDGETPCVVHAGSYGAVLAPGADAVLEQARRRRESATISYDINARPQVTGAGSAVRARVRDWVGLADLVKASDEDLETLWPELSQREAVELLLGLGPAVVVLTRGEHGASWYTPASAGQVPSRVVSVADTIGAGDTFSAGLVDALWERDLLGGRLPADVAWDEVLDWAARVAAVTVSRPGANPPTRDEVR